MTGSKERYQNYCNNKQVIKEYPSTKYQRQDQRNDIKTIVTINKSLKSIQAQNINDRIKERYQNYCNNKQVIKEYPSTKYQ